MPAIAPELQKALYKAHAHANARRSEFVTLEHITLFLIETDSVQQAFEACQVDTPRLQQTLAAFVQDGAAPAAKGGRQDARATPGYQRSMRRAALHAAATGSGDMLGINLLIAIYGDKEAQRLVDCLSDCGAFRQTIVDYHSTGKYVAE
jgi:ATP-dependent Clp protease ATP-binding subunit ClpA